MPLKIFTSTHADGSMKSVIGDEKSKVDQSRKDFLIQNNIQPDNTTLVRVAYEGNNYCRYKTIDNTLKGDGITKQSTMISDALVVAKLNHALFLPLADCIGAVLYEPKRNILMVSHLGRHNLEQNGGFQSVEFLINQHNVNPKDIIVWLSPAVGKINYPLFTFNSHSLHEVATEQLKNAGVLSKNISTSPIDTSTDKNYYSHSNFIKGIQSNDGRFAIVAIII